MPTTLERILDSTRATLPALRARRAQMEAEAAATLRPAGLLAGWDQTRVALIAEVKRRSPSAGEIAGGLDPVAHATAYARAGATAISVLTEGPFFGGSLDDLVGVARAAGRPTLRKDFILDEVQIIEARAAGAAAVLLIVRALGAHELTRLARAAADWGLDALVEVHDHRELDVALESGARLIGINSRNLDTFVIDMEEAWRLLARIPPDLVAVAESGMKQEADVRRAAEAGADAVLIGTALSSAPDPEGLARAAAGVPRRGR